MPSRTRRRLLAAGASAAATLLGGCISFGGGGSTDDTVGEEVIEGAPDSALVSTDVELLENEVTARIRTVRHTPDEGIAYVEGAINVPRELEYQIRLGVIDQNDVALAEDVFKKRLYETGTNLVSVELEVADCEACQSGLVDVGLSDSARQEIEREREEQQQEQQQDQQQREERMQEQQQSNETAGTTVTANESDDNTDEEEEGDD